MLRIQFIERVVDFPVVRQLRVPTVQTVYQTVEILQVPFLGLVLDMPVGVHRQVHGLRPRGHAATSSSRATVGVPLFSSSTEWWLRCGQRQVHWGKMWRFHRCSSWTRCSRTARASDQLIWLLFDTFIDFEIQFGCANAVFSMSSSPLDYDDEGLGDDDDQ